MWEPGYDKMKPEQDKLYEKQRCFGLIESLFGAAVALGPKTLTNENSSLAPA